MSYSDAALLERRQGCLDVMVFWHWRLGSSLVLLTLDIPYQVAKHLSWVWYLELFPVEKGGS